MKVLRKCLVLTFTRFVVWFVAGCARLNHLGTPRLNGMSCLGFCTVTVLGYPRWSCPIPIVKDAQSFITSS
jgi:hypothetical protein